MKSLICALALLSLSGFLSKAEDPAANPQSEQVRSAELISLAKKVNIEEWGQEARASNFGRPGRYRNTGGVTPNRDFDSLWAARLAPLDKNGNKRTFSIGWAPEQAQAEALLQRPCTSSQKRWLEDFIAAGNALKIKDPEKFKELVVPLADDARTML